MIPDLRLDITTDACPMTFVRTLLALDRLAPGQVLEVRLRGTEPEQSVPRAASARGHIVLSHEAKPDGASVLLLRRG